MFDLTHRLKAGPVDCNLRIERTDNMRDAVRAYESETCGINGSVMHYGDEQKSTLLPTLSTDQWVLLSHFTTRSLQGRTRGRPSDSISQAFFSFFVFSESRGKQLSLIEPSNH